MTLKERFYAKVQRTDYCWLWTGAKQSPRKGQPIGYGVLAISTNPFRRVLAHRLSWDLFRGRIPADKLVLHKCDTPSCVNPDHLFLGTQIENMADCAAKGRKEYGENSGRTTLTNAQVLDMRKRAAAGESVLSLAARFGKPHGTIWNIVNRKSWKRLLPQ